MTERERILRLIELIEADWKAAGKEQKAYAAEYLRMQIVDTAEQPAMSTNTYGLAYLATPYSLYSDGLGAAFIAASILAARLIRIGIHVYCPIAESHPIALYGKIDPLDQEFWRARNEHLMLKCNSLIVAHLDGWEQSQGIAWEAEKFGEWGRPIYDLDPSTLTMARRDPDWPVSRRTQVLCGDD